MNFDHPSIEHVQAGGFLKTPRRRGTLCRSNEPIVSHEIYVVDRVTPTQAIAVNIGGGHPGEIRVRRRDGVVMGLSYMYAYEATQEDIDADKAQRKAVSDYVDAIAALDDLIDQPMHRLNFSTAEAQMLGETWKKIKEGRKKELKP